MRATVEIKGLSELAHAARKSADPKVMRTALRKVSDDVLPHVKSAANRGNRAESAIVGKSAKAASTTRAATIKFGGRGGKGKRFQAAQGHLLGSTYKKQFPRPYVGAGWTATDLYVVGDELKKRHEDMALAFFEAIEDTFSE